MTVSATNFKKNPVKYLNEVVKTNGVINVQTEAGHVTILNTAEYERQKEILDEINDLNESEEDIKAGRVYSLAEGFKLIDEKLESLKPKAQQ
jgi:hypothetical protein